MYENITDRVDFEDGHWEELRVGLRITLDGFTHIEVKILNQPSSIFKFFEDEKIQLAPREYYDLKIRKGKKFLKFLKELNLRDTETLLEIVDKFDISKVMVAYIYDSVRFD